MTKVSVPNAISTESEEIHCISYLRGLAALGVVFHHVRTDLWVGFKALQQNPSMANSFAKLASWLSLPTIFMGSGVMLFFVISGFCIHYPYAGANGKRLDLKEYVVRRFFRIYPPYLIAVIFAFAVQWVGYHYGFLKGLDWRNYQLSTLLAQNSFGNQPECNGALWTIPIEIEFYMFFPLVYLGLRRFCFSTLGAGLALTVLMIALARSIHLIETSFLPYWFTWIAGAALAEQHKIKKLKSPPLWVCFIGILFLLSALYSTWSVRANDALAQGHGNAGTIAQAASLGYGIAYSVVLWWSLTNQRIYSMLPAYAHGLLLNLGVMSYSLYLFHVPLFFLCGWMWISIFGEKPINYFVTFPFVILALAVAWIAYRCIEAPSHAAGRKLARYIKERSRQQGLRRAPPHIT